MEEVASEWGLEDSIRVFPGERQGWNFPGWLRGMCPGLPSMAWGLGSLPTWEQL